MYSFSLPFIVLNSNEQSAFRVASERMKPFSVVSSSSVDVFDGSNATLYVVSFKSECEQFAKHRLMAFYYLFEHLSVLPFPDSFDNSEFEEDEK